MVTETANGTLPYRTQPISISRNSRFQGAGISGVGAASSHGLRMALCSFPKNFFKFTFSSWNAVSLYP